MADATVALTATNIFSLPSQFKTRSSAANTKLVNVAANNEVGDVACQKNIGEMTDYTQSATYCGTDFITDAGTLLTQFGNVRSHYTELITNGDFKDGATGWRFIAGSGSPAPVFKVVDGEGAFIQAAWTTQPTEYTDIRLDSDLSGYRFSIVQNKKYKIRLRIRSDETTAALFQWGISNVDTNQSTTGLFANFDGVTTVWKWYEWEKTALVSRDNCFFSFYPDINKNALDVYIDNISVHEAAPTGFSDVPAVVTGLNINMSAGQYATIEVTGHNHFQNEHIPGYAIGYADVSNFLPHEATEAFAGWDGFGVPKFGITTGTNSSPSSASVSFSMNHIDVDDEAGEHLAGKNITPRCELKMDFEGTPTSNTAALLEADFDANTNDMLAPLVDAVDSAGSNAAFDTFSFTAHANPALEVES
jgi:hypothetical protein